MTGPLRWLKRLTPKNLFGRALLIMALPLVLVQLIATYIFYDKHWASVARQLSASLAGEVAWLVESWHGTSDPETRLALLNDTARYMGLDISAQPSMRIGSFASTEIHFPVFERQLRRRIPYPFAIRYLPEQDVIHILILAEDAMLQIEAPKKRLASSTTLIFTGWTVGASLLLMLVAVLFLRNQIRPIVRLAEAAERFGKGQETPGFEPSGAREVRQAARAFIGMRERIRRQVASRTEMLAGISHDLRTPLTRIKLQLAMLPKEVADGLQQDVAEMEHMVEEYLAFARGNAGEASVSVSLDALMEEAIAPYRRQPGKVHITAIPERPVTLRPNAIRRALRNLVENALRYGRECWITVAVRRRTLIVTIEDDGPGIPESERERVFQPFQRLEASRNVESGGAGLGLSIVRDIVHGHGGEVLLKDSHHGGLKVIVSLPL